MTLGSSNILSKITCSVVVKHNLKSFDEFQEEQKLNLEQTEPPATALKNESNAAVRHSQSRDFD